MSTNSTASFCSLQFHYHLNMDKLYTDDQLNLFNYPARIIIAGYTNSGKTYLCTKIVEKYHHLFSKIVISGVSSHPLQDSTDIKDKLEIQEDIIDPVDEHSPFTDSKAHILQILDDNFLASANSPTVVNSFTKGRHKNLSVILITQNLFFPGKYARTIALNTSHYILMKNRDLYQIECLGRQLYGKSNSKKFVEIYKNAVHSTPRGYLLCDLAVTTPEALQLRTNIVGEGLCEKVFQL